VPLGTHGSARTNVGVFPLSRLFVVVKTGQKLAAVYRYSPVDDARREIDAAGFETHSRSCAGPPPAGAPPIASVLSPAGRDRPARDGLIEPARRRPFGRISPVNLHADELKLIAPLSPAASQPTLLCIRWAYPLPTPVPSCSQTSSGCLHYRSARRREECLRDKRPSYRRGTARRSMTVETLSTAAQLYENHI